MDSLDRESLLTLARHLGWPSVSIYLPRNPNPRETEHDQIVMKNLIREAEVRLVEGGLRSTEIDTLLAPLRSLVEEGATWRTAAAGLAVFVAEDTFYAFTTEATPPERASVSDRFLIRPILPAASKARFFVLALSKNHVRLLESVADEVREVEIPDIPSGLKDSQKYDELQESLQFHSRTPASAGGRGKRSAVFHGHGGTQDREKDDIRAYLRQVNRGLQALVRDDDAPLVLAGVEYLLPLYREVNSYPHLVRESITGNPEELSAADLAKRAQEVLEPHLKAELFSHRQDLKRLLGTGASSGDLREIVPAAHEGRVRVLFVSDRESDWGYFDPSSGRVEVHEERHPGDWDLTDLAAAETLLHGGVVHAGSAETRASAIFRY